MRVAVSYLGCRVNGYESDAMRESLKQAGYTVVSSDDVADVYIINTCTVTNIADRKSRQQISACHRLNPNAKLIVTGCWSQREPKAAFEIEGVYAVLGATGKQSVAELCAQIENGGDRQCLVRDVMHEHTFEEFSDDFSCGTPTDAQGRTRAYLKIQDGCDHFCSYCAIPYARGGIRSRAVDSVRRELIRLDSAGYTEVVLTGIHLTDYGRDIGGVTLADAVDCASGLDKIKRIRLGSLEPHGMNERLIERLTSNKRVCRQFHLSLQSGSTSVLSRMRRGYTADEYASIVGSIRDAYGADADRVAITTDIIAGFPQETQREHTQTLDFMQSIGFARVHVFPYSRRSGTPAALMSGQLTNAEKAARAAELIKIGKQLERQFLSGFIGRTEQVLIESLHGGLYGGYTDSYVHVRTDKGAPNVLVDVNIKTIEEEKDGELYLL